MRYGLKEQWRSVIEVLTEVIPFYDRMNRIMSWGRDLDWRRLGIERAVKPGDRVLDLGSGPGVMSQVALKAMGRLEDLVLLDALPQMLLEARRRVSGDKFQLVVGVFEWLPFRTGIFESVMCGYSIRDAIDMNSAYMEVIRVLREEGRLVIVDLGKPDNPVLRLFIALYWKLMVPTIAIFILGRRGRLYSALYRTYRRLPTNRELRTYLEELFRRLDFTTRMWGAAVIITGQR